MVVKMGLSTVIDSLIGDLRRLMRLEGELFKNNRSAFYAAKPLGIFILSGLQPSMLTSLTLSG